MNIINLTPHTVNIVNQQGEKIQDFPSKGNARVSALAEKIGDLNGIPLFTTTFGDVEDLPAPKKDTVYIVSRLVASAASDRDDLFVPSGLMRNEQGQVIGCLGLEKA